MVAYGRNLNHGPQNHGQNRPYNRKQVACRLCYRVLSSTQAPIAHIESHIVQGEVARLRQNQKQYPHPVIQPNNPFFFPNSPNIGQRFAPASPPPPQRRPLFPPSRAVQVQAQRPVPSQGPNLSLTLSGGAATGAQLVKINHSQRRPIVLPQVSPDPTARSGSGKLVNQPRRSNEMISRSDCIRPFLSQLDHAIPKVVDLEVDNEERLDLTLKL